MKLYVYLSLLVCCFSGMVLAVSRGERIKIHKEIGQELKRIKTSGTDTATEKKLEELAKKLGPQEAKKIEAKVERVKEFAKADPEKKKKLEKEVDRDIKEPEDEWYGAVSEWVRGADLNSWSIEDFKKDFLENKEFTDGGVSFTDALKKVYEERVSKETSYNKYTTAIYDKIKDTYKNLQKPKLQEELLPGLPGGESYKIEEWRLKIIANWTDWDTKNLSSVVLKRYVRDQYEENKADANYVEALKKAYNGKMEQEWANPSILSKAIYEVLKNNGLEKGLPEPKAVEWE